MSTNQALEKVKQQELSALLEIDNSTKRIQFALEKFKEQIAIALPAGRDINREIGSIISTVVNNPTLQKCSTESILLAAYKSASNGLPVDDLQLSYLVPYWNNDKRCYEAQYQISYRGHIQLAIDAGYVLDVEAEVVYTGEKFYYNPGKRELNHERIFGKDRGEFYVVYARAYLPNGMVKIVVMDANEVNHIRDKNPAKDNQGNVKSPAWRNDYDEMAKKVAIKRLLKTIPKYNTGLRVEQSQRVYINPSEPEESGLPQNIIGAAKAISTDIDSPPTNKDLLIAIIQDLWKQEIEINFAIPPHESEIKLDRMSEVELEKLIQVISARIEQIKVKQATKQPLPPEQVGFDRDSAIATIKALRRKHEALCGLKVNDDQDLASASEVELSKIYTKLQELYTIALTTKIKNAYNDLSNSGLTVTIPILEGQPIEALEEIHAEVLSSIDRTSKKGAKK